MLSAFTQQLNADLVNDDAQRQESIAWTRKEMLQNIRDLMVRQGVSSILRRLLLALATTACPR